MKFNKMVACGDFVKRQTPSSGFSHFVWSGVGFKNAWDELEKLVESQLKDPENIKPGYRDGVLLVEMPGLFFSTGIVTLNEKVKINASYAPRRIGEDSYIRLATKASKQRAMYASVVLYRWDVLEENHERETDAEWEVVAIKARMTREEEPMDPYTMARNFLHLKGGTKGDFSAEDFAKSIVYWNNHVMCQGKSNWFRKIIDWLKGY